MLYITKYFFKYYKIFVIKSLTNVTYNYKKIHNIKCYMYDIKQYYKNSNKHIPD